MEFIIEIIGELIFEILFETGSNSKISKWIRYPILFILISFYTVIVIGLLLLSIMLFKDNFILSIFLIVVDIIVILGFRKLLRKGKEKNKEISNER